MRIKGGLYKGDLAKVMDTDPSTQVGPSGTRSPWDVPSLLIEHMLGFNML